MSEIFNNAKDRWSDDLEKSSARDYDFKSLSGESLEVLYYPEYSENGYVENLNFPGQYPYTRGIHSNMYRGKLWTMRQFSGFSTPEQTNSRFKFLLQQGQTGLSVAYDMPTLMGYDADDELAEGEYPNQLPCPGDSGGPLYKRLPSGDIALVGIISNIKASPRVFAQVGQLPGHEICEKAFAANYIPVALHFNFLKENNITF